MRVKKMAPTLLCLIIIFANSRSTVSAITTKDLESIIKKHPFYSDTNCEEAYSASSSESSSAGKVSKKLESFVDQYGQMAYDNSIKSGVPYDFTLAQAILESGYGESGLTQRANNFFGIKAGSSWKGESLIVETREEDANGNSYTIRAAFRKYASPQDSFNDHDLFLYKNQRYKEAFKYSNDSYQFLVEVKKAGYATASDYVEVVGGVLNDVKDYILTKGQWPPSSEVSYSLEPPFDGSGGDGASFSSSGSENCGTGAAKNIGAVDIINKVSFDSDRTIEPKAIVLHWWGGTGGIDTLIGTLKQRNISVQIGTTTDGKVYQLTPNLNSYAPHAKCASSWAIGNEIEGGADLGPDPLGSGEIVALDLANNQKQFEAVVSVTAQLMKQFNIPLEGDIAADGSTGSGVHSHKEVDKFCDNANGKSDVDDVYLKRVKDELRKRGFQ